MKNLDLEKIIIILSLLLMPVAGGWVYINHQELEVAKRELAKVESMSGPVPQFFTLAKQLHQAQNSLSRQSSTDFKLYFRNRFAETYKNGAPPFSLSELVINQQRPRTISISRKGSKRRIRAEMITVDIKMGATSRGKERPSLARDGLNAYLRNCEAISPLWRLTKLSISAKDYDELKGRRRIPPMEMSDRWHVSNLQFSRVKPPESAK